MPTVALFLPMNVGSAGTDRRFAFDHPGLRAIGWEAALFKVRRIAKPFENDPKGAGHVGAAR